MNLFLNQVSKFNQISKVLAELIMLELFLHQISLHGFIHLRNFLFRIWVQNTPPLRAPKKKRVKEAARTSLKGKVNSVFSKVSKACQLTVQMLSLGPLPPAFQSAHCPRPWGFQFNTFYRNVIDVSAFAKVDMPLHPALSFGNIIHS